MDTTLFRHWILSFPVLLVNHIQDHNYSMILAVVGVVIVSSSLYLFWKRGKNSVKPSDRYRKDDKYEFCELMENEAFLIYVTPIPTLTFYRGDLPSSLVFDRLLEILKANPWLGARLVKDDRSSPLYAVHSKEFDESTLSSYFKEIRINNTELPRDKRFHETTSLDTLLSYVEPYFVQKGTSCLNKDNEVLFKVVVIKIIDYEYDHNRHNTASEENQERKPMITRTALVISMSHVIGDGYTYYKIFSFFDSNKEIIRMIPQRKTEEYTKRIYELQGIECKHFFLSPLFIGRIIWSFIFTRSFPKLQFYKVNKNEIQRIKKEFLAKRKEKTIAAASKEESASLADKKESCFLSTNDILTAWFFKECEVTYGMMACNTRNRIDGINDDLAGNYSSIIGYKGNDFENPYHIRRSLPHLSAHEERGRSKLPTKMETLGFHFGTVTNWSSFFHEVHFNQETNPFLFHCPILSAKECGINDFMTIFSPSEDELGVFILSHKFDKKEEYWHSSAQKLISSYF
jgi:hypothetical protein